MQKRLEVLYALIARAMVLTAVKRWDQDLLALYFPGLKTRRD